MSHSRDRTILERQGILTGPPTDPKWWTQERRTALTVLAQRHGLHQNMEATGGVLPKGRRSMIPSSVSSHHLHTNSLVLNKKNTGQAMQSLYNWGFAERIRTSRPRAAITPKGWAQLAAWGWMPEDWLPHAVGTGNVRLAKSLYKKLAVAKIVEDGKEAVKTIERVARAMTDAEADRVVRGKPELETEPPGLPVYDDEIEGILAKRAQSAHEVSAAAGMIGRHLRMTIGGMDQNEITEAVEQHFTPIEILRADLELLRARDANADFHTTMARTVLAHRLSAAGRFKRHTLADIADARMNPNDRELAPAARLRGVDRIAAGIEAGELERAGRALGMGDGATLGQVHERLQREQISEMEPPTGEPDINDLASHRAAWRKPLVDAMEACTPGSDDWLYYKHELNAYDRTMELASTWFLDNPQTGSLAVIERYDTGDYVTLESYHGGGHQNGAWSGVTIAYRNRHGITQWTKELRERKDFDGFKLANATHYTGFRFEVRRSFPMDDRLCTAIFSFIADNDAADNIDLELRVDQFIQSHRQYPDGVNVDMARIGNVETLKIRRAFSPFWSFVGCLVGGLAGGLVALFAFLVILGVIPR